MSALSMLGVRWFLLYFFDQNKFAQYALHLAALAQSPETLELLLAKGLRLHLDSLVDFDKY